MRRLVGTLLAAAAASAAQDSVAICILARDEGPFLAEFLDFYSYGGVAKAFVYVDDATADDTWAVLEQYGGGAAPRRGRCGNRRPPDDLKL